MHQAGWLDVLAQGTRSFGSAHRRKKTRWGSTPYGMQCRNPHFKCQYDFVENRRSGSSIIFRFCSVGVPCLSIPFVWTCNLYFDCRRFVGRFAVIARYGEKKCVMLRWLWGVKCIFVENVLVDKNLRSEMMVQPPSQLGLCYPFLGGSHRESQSSCLHKCYLYLEVVVLEVWAHGNGWN